MPKYAVENILVSASYLGDEFDVVVVADRPDRSLSRQGVKLVNARSIWPQAQRKALEVDLSRSGKDPRWRRHYWTHVIGRFAALKAYSSSLNQNVPIVHIENDVVAFFNGEILDSVFEGGPAFALAVDDNNVCPGLLFAEDPGKMESICNYVTTAVATGREASDMTALAELARNGDLKVLPTTFHPSGIKMLVGEGEDASEYSVVFDTIFLGQYLFGIDPRNEGGFRVPGVRLLTGGHDAGSLREWSVELCGDGRYRICAVANSGPVVLANLHVHAKVPLPHLEDFNEWSRILSAANGVTVPKVSIHWGAWIESEARKFAHWLLHR